MARVPGCPPEGYDVAKLRTIKESKFEITDFAKRQAFARNLLMCLSDPDAELRDKIAYEAYATWRHNKSLDATTWKYIEGSLLVNLDKDKPDPDGVIKPFAVLVLSEAVKVDLATPYLNSSERRSLLNAATGYLIALRDYRGFDSYVGWRHGVAHSADLLTQLALSPSFGKPELDQILQPLIRKLSPPMRTFIFMVRANVWP